MKPHVAPPRPLGRVADRPDLVLKDSASLLLVTEASGRTEQRRPLCSAPLGFQLGKQVGREPKGGGLSDLHSQAWCPGRTLTRRGTRGPTYLSYAQHVAHRCASPSSPYKTPTTPTSASQVLSRCDRHMTITRPTRAPRGPKWPPCDTHMLPQCVLRCHHVPHTRSPHASHVPPRACHTAPCKLTLDPRAPHEPSKLPPLRVSCAAHMQPACDHVSLLHSRVWGLSRTLEGRAQMGRALGPPTGPPHIPLRCPHLPVTGPLRVAPRGPCPPAQQVGAGRGRQDVKVDAVQLLTRPWKRGPWGSALAIRQPEPRCRIPARVWGH